MRNLSAILAALPSLGVAATFLITWIRPETLGDNMLQDLLCLMLLEFIMMHATTFLSAMPLLASGHKGKIVLVVIFAVIYSLFGIVMPLSWGAPWLIVGFAMLAGQKVYAVVRDPKEPSPAEIMSWGAGIALYILFVASAALLPFPRFGITADSVRPPGGDKFDDPHCIIAAGMLYWLGMAATNYFVTKAQTDAAAPVHAAATAAHVSP